jgi:fumarate reductase subunit D
MADNPLQTMPQSSAPADVVRDQDKIMLVLAYLGILALIPMLTVKDSEYVKWHAKQGLALAIVAFGGILVLGFIPVINILAGCVLPLGYLALVIFAIVQAFKPVRWKIPGVSSLAEKL